jgi:type I restriction enzyme S subunit
MADLMLNRHSREDGKPELSSPENLITQHIDIWTTAIERKSSAGRGTSNKFSLYGIKKLRELILELAVRGKLVPQDVNDEPASILLERIAAEKAQLVKEGKLKKQKPLPEISDDEKPFELPSGWSFVRLGNITTRLGSGSTPRGGQSAYVDHGIPFLRSQNVWNDGLKLDDIAYITHETHEVMSNTKVLGNDVLLNITGASLGRTTVFPTSIGEANVNQHVTIIRLINIEMCKFVHLGLMSPMVQKLVWGRQVGMAIEGLSKKVLEQFEFPIPPLEEQHRIVAKVDELMCLCDALEAQTEASIGAHQTLVETLLNALLLPNITQQKDRQSSSPEPSFADSLEPALNDSFVDSWQCVAEHFDTLFTTAASIDTLKQTILQLAVMGKLVPQDENDEPAAKLLERITAEKVQLIKDGKIKKQKRLPTITDAEKPFELPQGWEWNRVGNYTYVFAGNSFKSGDFNNQSGTRVVKITNAGVCDFIETEDFLPSEFAEKYTQYQVMHGDLILALTRPYISAGLKISICPNGYDRSLLNQRVAAIRTIYGTGFTFLFLRSPVVLAHYQQRFGGSGLQPNLKMSDVTELFIAIPPLEEQHRIVAKVDELMALCDQLKTRLSDAQTTQLHLTDAIVEQAI